jgi:mitogen-activated protein kinase organizer 1
VGSPVRLQSQLYFLAFHTRSLSAQNRQPIQALEEARDSVQALYVGSSRIMSGSVDGHVRTYDLRKGELRADYIGRTCATDIPKRCLS